MYLTSEASPRRALLLLALVSAALALAGAMVQMESMLRSVNVTDVFSRITLADADRVKFALYLIFPAAGLAAVLWSGYDIFKGFTRRGGAVAGLAAFSLLVALGLPSSLGYPPSPVGLALKLAGAAAMAALALQGLRARGVEVKEGVAISSVETAMVGVFSALTAVLTSMTGQLLPSPTGGYTHIGDTAIYAAALLFGVRVGGLVGIIGPVVADLYVGYPRWFVTVVAHGVQGFVAGLGRGRRLPLQVAILVLSGFAMSTTYFFVNIYIRGLPVAVLSYVRDLFVQSLVSIILGLIVTKAAQRALPSLRK